MLCSGPVLQEAHCRISETNTLLQVRDEVLRPEEDARPLPEVRRRPEGRSPAADVSRRAPRRAPREARRVRRSGRLRPQPRGRRRRDRRAGGPGREARRRRRRASPRRGQDARGRRKTPKTTTDRSARAPAGPSSWRSGWARTRQIARDFLRSARRHLAPTSKSVRSSPLSIERPRSAALQVSPISSTPSSPGGRRFLRQPSSPF